MKKHNISLRIKHSSQCCHGHGYSGRCPPSVLWNSTGSAPISIKGRPTMTLTVRKHYFQQNKTFKRALNSLNVDFPRPFALILAVTDVGVESSSFGEIGSLFMTQLIAYGAVSAVSSLLSPELRSMWADCKHMKPRTHIVCCCLRFPKNLHQTMSLTYRLFNSNYNIERSYSNCT